MNVRFPYVVGDVVIEDGGIYTIAAARLHSRRFTVVQPDKAPPIGVPQGVKHATRANLTHLINGELELRALSESPEKLTSRRVRRHQSDKSIPQGALPLRPLGQAIAHMLRSTLASPYPCAG
jgi:hypothetical protein